MRLWSGLSAVALLACTSPAWSQVPAPTPTPSDVYVSCYLFVRDSPLAQSDGEELKPYGPETCAAYGIMAFVHYEGRAQAGEYKFCAPTTSDVRTNFGKAFAHVYIDFYKARADMDAKGKGNGKLAYLAALLEKWPCTP